MTDAAAPWRRESREEWNELAATTSTVTLLPDDKDPTRIRVEGRCPACGHETAHSEPLQLVSVADAVPAVTRAKRRLAAPTMARRRMGPAAAGPGRSR